MTHQNIIDKLQEIRPGSHWVMRGTAYEGLEWLDDPATKPTAEEIGL